MSANEMIFACPKCGSRNLIYTLKTTTCRECGWSNEKIASKIKRKITKRKKKPINT